MKRIHKRVAWAAVVLIALVCAMLAFQAEYFSVAVFEWKWTQRLKALQAPEEIQGLFKHHGAGDYFQKTYPTGEWLVGVSASSCGNGRLIDLLLIKDCHGGLHKITDVHFCGRNGIVMAIPELESDSYQTAVNAISAKERCQAKK